MVIEPPNNLEISLVSYNVCHKENILHPSAIQTSSVFRPKNAHGRNYQEYY